MIIEWQVWDGYLGGSRPQTTYIPDNELEDCETNEEKEELINEYIQDDFNQKIGWSIIDNN